MASGAIEISDSEDEPTVADKSAAPETEITMNGSYVTRAAHDDTLHSSEEYEYDPAEDDVDLNDVSLHASDIEEGDIFADDLKKFTGKYALRVESFVATAGFFFVFFLVR